MNWFLLDASALVKRYFHERGSALIDHLFAQASRDRLACLMLGAAEVVAALVRKRNGGLMSPALFRAAISRLNSEVLTAADFTRFPADNSLVHAAIALLEPHGINSADAVVLRLGLDLVAQYRAAGDDLVLVASDRRLIRAAHAEGLLTFDPETQPQPDLDALLGS